LRTAKNVLTDPENVYQIEIEQLVSAVVEAENV
jgi:hypothetical protein